MRSVILAIALGLLGTPLVFAHGNVLHEGTIKEEAAVPGVALTKTIVVPAEEAVTPEVKTHEHESTDQPKLVPVDSEWAFVGCVSSRHDCSHHAHQGGYSSHRVEQDEDTCPSHPHLACYGQ